MKKSCIIVILALVNLVIASANAVDIAIVDYADEWNKKACMGLLLDDLGKEYDDLSADVEAGNFSLAGYKIFIIGAFVTNSTVLHNSLDANADEIESFVAGGGVVIEMTQADQNQANLDWLPGDLVAVRSDTDYAQIVILEPDHPMFQSPNKLSEGDISNWGISSGTWSSAWETFASQSGFTVIAARDANGTNPCILEATYKQGRILLLSIALDKKHVLGTTPESIENSMHLMENILAGIVVSVEASGKIATAWGGVKSIY
jgi:hypothetical protein